MTPLADVLFRAGLCLVLLPAPVLARTPDPAGIWEGTLEAKPVELTIVFHVARGADGTLTATMDSPEQGAKGIPVSEVSCEGKADVSDSRGEPCTRSPARSRSRC